MGNRSSIIATVEAAVSIGAALARRPELVPLAFVGGLATLCSTYLAFTADVQQFAGRNQSLRRESDAAWKLRVPPHPKPLKHRLAAK